MSLTFEQCRIDISFENYQCSRPVKTFKDVTLLSCVQFFLFTKKAAEH